jgi:Glycosyl transferase family 11
MIIVKLIGGLGNQMFQYAIGRHLSERLSTLLKLDLSEFETDKFRRYSLHYFNIRQYIATETEIQAVKEPVMKRSEQVVAKILWQLGFSQIANKMQPTGNIINEKEECKFAPEVLSNSGNLYLQGFWQSELYFVDIRKILLREFTIKHLQSSYCSEIEAEITSTASVSLHVRRGDYARNPKTNEYHGLCSLEYYQRAVEKILTILPNPHFFVFSDDLLWVKQEFKFDIPMTLVGDTSNTEDYEELWLMSRCQHQIIANSSFSWWGAWLNPNPNKIVCAPYRWFNSAPIDPRDLIPETWIKL